MSPLVALAGLWTSCRPAGCCIIIAGGLKVEASSPAACAVLAHSCLAKCQCTVELIDSVLVYYGVPHGVPGASRGAWTRLCVVYWPRCSQWWLLQLHRWRWGTTSCTRRRTPSTGWSSSHSRCRSLFLYLPCLVVFGIWQQLS
jgi:hypothetical protein